MAQLLGWIRESGSLDYAQRYAAQQGERGLRQLAEALSADGDPAAAQILGLARSYVTREA